MKLGLSNTWVRLVISGGLMILLLSFLVNWREALTALAGADWRYLGVLAVWITLDRWLMSYKWTLLLRCRGLAIGQWEAFRAYYIATFAGCFLPSTVGADALRVGAVCGPERPSEVVAASAVVERVLGFAAAVLAALLALALLAGLAVELPRGVLTASLVLMLVSLAAMILSLSRWAETLSRRLEEFLAGRGRLASWGGRFLSAYAQFRRHPGTLAWFLLLSFVEQCVPVVGTWLAALALDIPLTLLQATAVAPLALLFTRIPVSVSGFGVVEGLYVAFFSLVGLNATDSFLLGLIANLSIVVTTLPGAAFFASGGYRAVKDRAQSQACRPPKA